MVDYRDLKGAFKPKGPYAKLIPDVDYFHEYYERYRKEKIEETGIYSRHTSRKYEDAEKFVLFGDMVLHFISNVHYRLEKANQQHRFIRSLLYNKIPVTGESLEKYLDSFLADNSNIDGYFSNLFDDKLAQLGRIKGYFSDKEWRYQNYKAYIEFDKKSEQTQYLRELYKEYNETWLYLYLGIQEQFGILIDTEDCNKVTLNIAYIKQKIGSMQ